MQGRSQTTPHVSGDLSALTAYADTERQAKVTPTLLEEWMPAFLAQLTAPGAQLTRATSSDGSPLLYVFDMGRESFAQFIQDGDGWTVRQGGPVALWDDIEHTLAAWQDANSPDITTVRLHVSDRAHTYWIGGQKIASAAGPDGSETTRPCDGNTVSPRASPSIHLEGQ